MKLRIAISLILLTSLLAIVGCELTDRCIQETRYFIKYKLQPGSVRNECIKWLVGSGGYGGYCNPLWCPMVIEAALPHGCELLQFLKDYCGCPDEDLDDLRNATLWGMCAEANRIANEKGLI